jgi:hypothetical protein
MSARRSFVVHAGPHAAAHIRERGLRADDIAGVPAAAGGPKGLAPIELDKRLFDPRQGGLDKLLPWRRRPRGRRRRWQTRWQSGLRGSRRGSGRAWRQRR